MCFSNEHKNVAGQKEILKTRKDEDRYFEVKIDVSTI